MIGLARCVWPLFALLAAGTVAAQSPPGGVVAVASSKTPPRTVSEILAATVPSDWRALDPENTLYLDLAAGRVVIELLPDFAPAHAANVKALVREGNVMWTHLAGNLDPPSFRIPEQKHAASRADVLAVDGGVTELSKQNIACDDDLLGDARPAGQTKPKTPFPFVHDPITDK